MLVVLHDGTLNRTVRGAAENCSGAVASKTLAQINTCDAGVWFGAEWAGEKSDARGGIETKTPAPEDHTPRMPRAWPCTPTGQHDADISRRLSIGVDGMFTNFPDRLNAVLDGGAPIGLPAARQAASVMRRCRGEEIDPGGSAGGVVPATLSLTLGPPPSFGTFTPRVAKDCTASTTANVVSTAGDASLTVGEPGRLANGTFSLAVAAAASRHPERLDRPGLQRVADDRLLPADRRKRRARAPAPTPRR